MKKLDNVYRKQELTKEDVDFVYKKLGFSTRLDFDYNRELVPTKLYDPNFQETTIVFGETKVNALALELLSK